MVAFLSVPISFNNDWFTGLSGWNRNHGFYHDSLGFLNPTLLDWRREVIDCDIDQPCKVHIYFSSNDYFKPLREDLYTYDRIAEDYSWHHIEPAEECPVYSDFCDQTSTKAQVLLLPEMKRMKDVVNLFTVIHDFLSLH